jgi:hypothetical protein
MLLIAGCVAPTEEPTLSMVPPTSEAPAAPIPVVSAKLLENATTGGAVNYTVNTTAPVTVTLRLNGTVVTSELVEASRTWMVPLPYGRTPLTASFVAAGLDRSESYEVVRLGLTKLTIDYGVFHPASQGSQKTDKYDVWIDVDARPSEALYAQQKAKHLDAFTAHDQLVLFEALTGKKVTYSWNANFQQFGVDKIDGAGNAVSASAPPWWCYTVNAKSANGISIQTLVPGDSVVWRLGTCS